MKLKKGDIVVIVISLCLFFLSLGIAFSLKGKGRTVNVYENDMLVFTGSLFNDKTVNLSHNTVVIKNGKAYMEKADCKNQICVRTGKISDSRECVVCLPNKVIIEIE